MHVRMNWRLSSETLAERIWNDHCPSDFGIDCKHCATFVSCIRCWMRVIDDARLQNGTGISFDKTTEVYKVYD